METMFMNTEDSKTNEPHTLPLILSQRLDLKSLGSHVPLQIYLFITRGKI